MSKMKDAELSYKDELMGIFSDMYKDINGFRPRGMVWEQADDLTTEELSDKLSRMSDMIGEQIDRDRKYTADYMANVAAAEVDPNGFVWEGDYDYYADTTTQAYIVPTAPANDAMASAFAKAAA